MRNPSLIKELKKKIRPVNIALPIDYNTFYKEVAKLIEESVGVFDHHTLVNMAVETINCLVDVINNKLEN